MPKIKFLWVDAHPSIRPIKSLMEFLFKLYGQEVEIKEIKYNYNQNANFIISKAEDSGQIIIVPFGEIDPWPFIEACSGREMTLLFPFFDNCKESESEITISVNHYLKFTGFQKLVITSHTTGVCLQDDEVCDEEEEDKDE